MMHYYIHIFIVTSIFIVDFVDQRALLPLFVVRSQTMENCLHKLIYITIQAVSNNVFFGILSVYSFVRFFENAVVYQPQQLLHFCFNVFKTKHIEEQLMCFSHEWLDVQSA